MLRLPVHYDALGGALPAWDPVGERLAVPTRGGLVVVHLREPEPLVLGGWRERARSMAWSPGGDTLAVAYDERDLQRLLRVVDCAEIWRSSIGETAVDDLTWSPDGRQVGFVGEEVVVCSAETGATLWRRGEKRTRYVAGVDARREGDRIHVVEHVRSEEDRIFPGDAQWSPDAGLLAARWGDAFRVLGARDGEVKAEGTISEGVLRWTSWGEALFEDGKNRLGKCVSRIADRWSRTTTFSRDGRFVAAEGEDHRLWIQDEHGVRAIDGHPRTIKAMAWSANGVLATACRDGMVRMLSRSDGDLEAWARLDVEYGALVWSPDGAHLAACCEGSVVVLPATV
jgi:WD40 repeat protein